MWDHKMWDQWPIIAYSSPPVNLDDKLLLESRRKVIEAQNEVSTNDTQIVGGDVPLNVNFVNHPLSRQNWLLLILLRLLLTKSLLRLYLLLAIYIYSCSALQCNWKGICIVFATVFEQHNSVIGPKRVTMRLQNPTAPYNKAIVRRVLWEQVRRAKSPELNQRAEEGKWVKQTLFKSWLYAMLNKPSLTKLFHSMLFNCALLYSLRVSRDACIIPVYYSLLYSSHHEWVIWVGC